MQIPQRRHRPKVTRTFRLQHAASIHLVELDGIEARIMLPLHIDLWLAGVAATVVWHPGRIESARLLRWLNRRVFLQWRVARTLALRGTLRFAFRVQAEARGAVEG